MLQNSTTETIFLDYVLRQNQNIRDLDNVQKLFQGSRQFTALVGAVKAKAEILDKVIEKGQEFGFFAPTLHLIFHL